MTSQSLEHPGQEKNNLLVALTLSIALIAVSLAAIFIRLSELEISPNATIFNRLWIATVAIAFWRVLENSKVKNSTTNDQPQDSPASDKSRQTVLLLSMGIVSSISLILWAWSLTQTTVANSVVIRNLTPVFTTLGGIILGQAIYQKFMLGMVIALLGAISIGIGDFEYSMMNVWGDLAALVSAMFYGINLLIVERLRLKLKSTEIILWRCFLGTLVILPFAILTEGPIFPDSKLGWLSVIALALVCQLLGQGLLIYSLKKVSSAFVSVLLLLEPAISALLAWIVFAESLTLANGLGFLVILVGVYIAKLPAPKEV